MAGSEEVNSHPVGNRDDAKFLVTGAELKAIVNDAVAKALERQYSEYSETKEPYLHRMLNQRIILRLTTNHHLLHPNLRKMMTDTPRMKTVFTPRRLCLMKPHVLRVARINILYLVNLESLLEKKGQ